MGPETIIKKFNELDTRYKKKMKTISPMIPPPIRAEILNSIADDMDKLEKKLNNLGYEIIGENSNYIISKSYE